MQPLPVLAAAAVYGLAVAPIGAQEAEPATSPSLGLPGKGVEWKFNFDAGMGYFSFADSLYTNPKPEQPSGDLTDDWLEGFVKPALSGAYTTASSAQFYGGLSAVGERTYGAAPSLVGASVYAQALWLWSSCALPPFGLSSSRGLALTLLAP